MLKNISGQACSYRSAWLIRTACIYRLRHLAIQGRGRNGHIIILPWPKNRYSREIPEVDLQFDHVISCDIKLRFDIDVTRGVCASWTCVADRSRCRMISHDFTADQSHEYLGCNDFLARVVSATVRSVTEERTFSRARLDVLNFRLRSYHVLNHVHCR